MKVYLEPEEVDRLERSARYLRDMAKPADSAFIQTNIVRVDGQRAALLQIQRSAGASTLDIIARVKEAQVEAPELTTVRPIGDVLGRLPAPGDVVEFAGFEWRVERLTGRAVASVRVARLPASAGEGGL